MENILEKLKFLNYEKYMKTKYYIINYLMLEIVLVQGLGCLLHITAQPTLGVVPP